MSRQIALISCASKKLNHPSKAKDLYISTLFTSSLKYAYTTNPDAIFILSAKYGLLSLDTEIEPYNITLNNMTEQEIKEWARMVIEQLRERTDVDADHFIILAGQKYRKYLVPYLKSYELPLEGLTIGKQLQYLKTRS